MSTASIPQPVQDDLFPSTADANRMAYVGHQPGTPERDGDAWYTPSLYVESARRVMGSIDLDPFSSAEANAIVKAASYFSEERSGLTHPWRPCPWQYPAGVNVFMNPPFGGGFTTKALAALLAAYDAGDLQQAIVLVNNATETKWFQRAPHHPGFRALCITNHRIAFLAPDGKEETRNTRGQIFFYFATPQHQQTARFRAEFERYGLVNDGGWGSPPPLPVLPLFAAWS